MNTLPTLNYRLVDFLIGILKTHAESLNRLAALFGEDLVFDMLENAPEDFPSPAVSQEWEKLFSLFAPLPTSGPLGDAESAYRRLESEVSDQKMAEFLEFHVWAFPFYRAFAESALDLRAPVQNSESAAQLIDAAVMAAKEWRAQLPIAEEYRARAESAASLPWIRFRTELMDRFGTRRLGTVISRTE
jgi:hypothetical protein